MAVVFTQADLDNLKAAYVSGARKVQVGNRLVEYNSPDEILKAMETVANYLAGNSTSIDDNPSVIQSTFSRGES